MKNKIIGIIPARGGSKGIPQKNIRPLVGKPLIAWTIEAAKKTELDRIIVSTDDRKIAAAAQKYGAEIPFLRPKKLARDHSPTLPVLQHAVSWLECNESYKPEIIVLLQPTSPLRTAKQIEEAIKLLHKTKADSVVSMCVAEHNPYWMRTVKKGRVYPFVKSAKEYTRRQDLPEVYRLNGAIYVTRYEILMKQNRILGKDTRALVMDSDTSVDVDTFLDFKMAEFLLKKNKAI